jgi:hypothetical protein
MSHQDEKADFYLFGVSCGLRRLDELTNFGDRIEFLGAS